VLIFGALGEELMFHGYGFQQLVRQFGAFSIVLPVGVLFGLMHAGNQGASLLSVINTAAWGMLLGYAYLRTGALWLPVGLHFGWNLAAPLLGMNLSGFTMRVTGYELLWNTRALWSGGDYGIEGSLFTLAMVVVLFMGLRRTVEQA
jgi:membrane protease YdiL (CAAX protease family)